MAICFSGGVLTRNLQYFGWVFAALACITSLYSVVENNVQMNRFDISIDNLRKAANNFESFYETRVKRDLQRHVDKSEERVVKRSAADDDDPPVEYGQYFFPGVGGASYIRWGRSDCPGNTLTKLVYSGIAAGTHYSHAGGGSNYICLDADIKYQEGGYVDGNKGSSHIYGVEFRDGNWIYPLFNLSETENNALQFHSLPCALCFSQVMVTKIMIPDREKCPNGWHLEYRGYIMAGSHGDTHASKFICVDEKPQVIPGTQENTKGSFLFMVETQCPSLLCEPFIVNRELRCVVCSF